MRTTSSNAFYCYSGLDTVARLCGRYSEGESALQYHIICGDHVMRAAIRDKDRGTYGLTEVFSDEVLIGDPYPLGSRYKGIKVSARTVFLL